MNNEAQVKQVHSNYAAQANKARYDSILNSCSPLDQEIIKTLGLLDQQSNGRLARLFRTYQMIKNNTTHEATPSS